MKIKLSQYSVIGRKDMRAQYWETVDACDNEILQQANAIRGAELLEWVNCPIGQAGQ